jgi:integrase
MGLLVKHVKDHPSGRSEFRRRFPDHLRDVIGRREHKVSLGRKGEKGFLTRYEQAAATFDETVATAERKHLGRFDRLDGPLIRYLAALHEVSLHEGSEATVKSGKAGQGLDAWDYLLDDFKQWRFDRDSEAAVAQWGGSARRQLDAQGLLLDPNDTACFEELCLAFNDAAIAASEQARARLRGDVVAIPAGPVAPPPAAPTSLAAPPVFSQSRVPLIATFDAYAAAQGLTPGVRDEWRRYVERLIDFLGHDDAALLTTEHLRTWRDQLLQEPSRKGGQRSPVTVRDKYITSVRAMLAWAVEEGQLPLNVAADVTVRVPRTAKLRERDFTSEEALAILTASLEPVAGRLSPGYARARRWIPWLCAYTGGRVNEFSQLRGQDVREVEGIWTVRITPEAGTVKAKEARLVPLHPHLIEQGFLDVVRANGPGPIFFDPDKQRVAGDSNRHFKKVGERLAAWVRKDVGIDDPALQPNHAWRHTFKTLSYTAGIEERVADAIQGHAPKTTGRRYGRPPLSALNEAINLIPRFDVPGA